MTESTKKNIDLLAPATLTGLAGYWFFRTKGGKDWRQLLLIMVVAFAITYLIVSRVTKIAVESSLAALDRQMQQQVLEQSGITAAQYAQAGAIAEKIYHAFHDNWNEDEEMAIDALNSAGSVPMVNVVAQIYQQRYSYGLKADFDRYTSRYNRTVTPFADYVTQALNLS